MWEYRRHTRKFLVLGQILLSMAVEATLIADKPAALAICCIKLLGFQWFAVYARWDAPRRSVFVLPGIWLDHDNFHGAAALRGHASRRAAR
jgi:hypothetical protein